MFGVGDKNHKKRTVFGKKGKEKVKDMKKEEAKVTLMERIKEERDMFFGEIEDFFESIGYDYKGGKSIRAREGSNLVIWVNWNDEAISILNEIMEVKGFTGMTANPIEIAIMEQLVLPLAKQINRNYREPHWLPCKIAYVGK